MNETPGSAQSLPAFSASLSSCHALEKKWQDSWQKRQRFAFNDERTRPHCYVLEMFPYPSGRIHMGHVRNYTIGDVLARYKSAKGYEVLHPMGWDAFGMPAENAAFENKTHPERWTFNNIRTMRTQLMRMGLSVDWSREIATCHPEYYRHEQGYFLDFLARGLAYRKEAFVNWDPVEHCVLANEQVIDGRGWRSGALVEKRKLAQWFLRITKYRQELLEGLEALEHWPESVRVMQKNWIGKHSGAKIRFQLLDEVNTPTSESFEVFTTRADTLFGASFCALAPTHPLVSEWAKADKALRDFSAQCAQSHESAEKKRSFHREMGKQSDRFTVSFAGLCGQFRADGIRHRSDFWLPSP